MLAVRSLFHLARADFLERVRRYSFLVSIGLAAFLAYQVLVGNFTMMMEDYRGIYNAAWMGLLMSMTLTFFLSIFGFYLVKGNVERDRTTGVGQILATTPMQKLSYLSGKFLSSFMVLMAIAGVMVIAGLFMLLTQGEDKTLDLWGLIAPFLLLTVPVAVIVAGFAVLFEAVPFLSGGFGNIVYFFIWTFSLPATNLMWLGADLIEGQAKRQLQQIDPSYGGGFLLGADPSHIATKTFVWTGIDLTPEIISTRLIMIGFGLLLVLLAVLPFDRFDPSRRREAGQGRGWLARLQGWMGKQVWALLPHRLPSTASTVGHLTPLTTADRRPRFLGVLIAELKLMLKGQPWWWYVGAAGVIFACLLSPFESEGLQRFALPIAWLWPLLIWSQMGTREARHNTGQIVFSAPAPTSRQLPATWVAGVIVSMLLGSGAAIRFAAAGELAMLGGWLIGALFLPSLALALGVWSGSSRAFEILVLTLWYIGPMNGIPQADYTLTTEAARSIGMPLVYLGLTVAAMMLAVWGRHRQTMA